MSLSVRPGNIFAISVHLLPYYWWASNIIFYYFGDHSCLFMAGSRWLCHLRSKTVTFLCIVCRFGNRFHIWLTFSRWFRPNFWCRTFWRGPRWLYLPKSCKLYKIGPIFSILSHVITLYYVPNLKLLDLLCLTVIRKWGSSRLFSIHYKHMSKKDQKL